MINLLQKKKVGCIRIDGGTPSSMRQALVNEFQEKIEIKAAVVGFFLLSIGFVTSLCSDCNVFMLYVKTNPMFHAF